MPNKYITTIPTSPDDSRSARVTKDLHVKNDGDNNKELEVRICSRARRALTTSSDADAWISTYLRFPCELLGRQDEEIGEKKRIGSTEMKTAVRDVSSVVSSFANEAPPSCL